MVILFYVCAVLAVLAALGVVFQRRPVYSALSLIVVLCSLAVIYLLLGAEFLAVIQVIIYAGAIMVLFVLVIMLLNARTESSTDRSRIARWLGAPLIAALLVEIVAVVWKQFPSANTPPAAPLDAGPAAIGQLLFRNYVLPFEVTSLLILVAIMGAVVLAKKQL
ncbi:MAG TPA: NADH-quinone oxidoreductase subunit J [Candidatus Sulfotelmatobacter sp.]|jgi:NADH-quinone oxidoreductase subunit J|nr:NADH-quinone oxidoreductase subunit J [Candidatus Sulfotelmatobacter sp.]